MRLRCHKPFLARTGALSRDAKKEVRRWQCKGGPGAHKAGQATKKRSEPESNLCCPNHGLASCLQWTFRCGQPQCAVVTARPGFRLKDSVIPAGGADRYLSKTYTTKERCLSLPDSPTHLTYAGIDAILCALARRELSGRPIVRF